MTPAAVKQELYRITQAETGMTSTDAAAAVAGTWQEVFRYQIPVDMKITFRPGHTFSAYISTLVPGEWAATNKIKVTLQDAGKTQEIALVQETNYVTIKEFQDRSKIKRIDLLEAKAATPGSYIVISAKALISVDVSLCYWELTCDRKRIGLVS